MMGAAGTTSSTYSYVRVHPGHYKLLTVRGETALHAQVRPTASKHTRSVHDYDGINSPDGRSLQGKESAIKAWTSSEQEKD